MPVTLVDTNVLLRLAQPGHPQYSMAVGAVAELHRQKANLCIATQNLVEFWVVATSPVSNNGLGLSPLTVASRMQVFHGIFRILEGTPGVAAAWEMLVRTHLVSGKQAHDAHLVAVMRVYAVTNLLTFNIADFKRFPGITLLDPAQF